MENGYNIGFGEGYREGMDDGMDEAFEHSDKFFSLVLWCIFGFVVLLLVLFTYKSTF